MAADVHRRGHGRSVEGLSVVAGAAHLLPPDTGLKNNAQAAMLRASYQQYVGVSSSSGDASSGQMSFRQRTDSFGPKLVQGDYTYTTSRKSLLVSSQVVGAGPLPQQGGPGPAGSASHAGSPRGTIPAMMPVNAGIINTAAWKAYGSPRARNHQRPPVAPNNAGSGGGGMGPAPTSPSGSRLPRVGGFKPRRPQSAPNGGAEGGPDLGPVIAAIASGVNVSGRRHGKATDTMDVGVLAVEQPDPIWAGRTDSGKIMFEYTLPTDPYAKYIWEEQARKARANMTRHIAAMAAAAAVNGGNAFSHSSGFASTATAALANVGGGSGNGNGSGSRPGSAKRGAVGTSMTASGSPTAMATSWATGMRPRFSSTTIAEATRQGPDHKPPTIVGFGAPNITEDTTMPGPGDPRWAYTRLGSSQVRRLQQSLKMCNAPRHHMRPSSAPALSAGGNPGTLAVAAAPGAAVCVGVGTDNSFSAGGIGVVTSERSMMAQAELSVLDPFADPSQGGAAAAAALMRAAPPDLEVQRSTPFAVPRTGSGSGGTRPGSAGIVRPGSATFARTQSSNLARTGSPGFSAKSRPGSAGVMRQGSAGVVRPGSASGTGGVGSAVNLAAALMAEAAAAPPVPPVRGASAGRTREAAPNPRVDLRMYLADAEADAEGDEVEGTEMLPVGDLMAGGLYDGNGAVLIGPDGLPLSAEVLQSMPVPADQLAARLAEMVAAVAVVAAQKQIDGSVSDDNINNNNNNNNNRGSRHHFQIEEVGGDDEQTAGLGTDGVQTDPPAAPETLPPAPPSAPLSTRFSRPEGDDDALAALHGTSSFGGRGSSRLSSTHSSVHYESYGSGQYDSDSLAGWGDDQAAPPMEQPLGLGLGLGLRPSSRAGRPASARPTSARPASALPGRRSGSPVRLPGDGGGLDGGMAVIMEQSEGNLGEDS